MRLALLAQELPEIHSCAQPELEINGLTVDSRQVKPGYLFVAVRGTRTDGHLYLGEAVRQGALALVGEQPDPGLGRPYWRVADSRLALARLAATWYGNPARHLTMIGVTGTDGKTTTASLIFHILQAAGLAAGLISTVHAQIGDQVLDTGYHVTTPDPIEVQSLLARMVQAGLTHCVLEATSHGLAQRRVAACEFDLGVVTNVTHEHLDFHGSYQRYLEAKALLVEDLGSSAIKPAGPAKAAILNRDDSSYAHMHRVARVKEISYGLQPGADLTAAQIESGERGLRFVAQGEGYDLPVSSPLVGRYNVFNCLAAIATSLDGLGLPPETVGEGLAALQSIPGRMERIDLGQSFTAIVDFAHTPNALRRALETARAMTNGRVIAVFGSAGERDQAKRRMMAEISAVHADLTVLTAEDPRSEPLDAILEEMLRGAVSRGGREGQDVVRVPDRGQALRFAVRQAQPGDLVIACGKGHEQSMCFGETEYPWDDRLAMRAALAELLSIDGPAMPFLPSSD